MTSSGGPQDYAYIDDDASLVAFCCELGKASYCAIDTEFIRESTYYPELALIQIASEELLACIDPLAITPWPAGGTTGQG